MAGAGRCAEMARQVVLWTLTVRVGFTSDESGLCGVAGAGHARRAQTKGGQRPARHGRWGRRCPSLGSTCHSITSRPEGTTCCFFPSPLLQPLLPLLRIHPRQLICIQHEAIEPCESLSYTATNLQTSIRACHKRMRLHAAQRGEQSPFTRIWRPKSAVSPFPCLSPSLYNQHAPLTASKV